ncbi:hypothetical protein [Symmachiella dynata]|nr:hypothetical protein [Symmachiella dynata]
MDSQHSNECDHLDVLAHLPMIAEIPDVIRYHDLPAMVTALLTSP